MSGLANLALKPLALIFTLSFAHPMLAIGLSAAAGIVAHLLGRNVGAAFFAGFMAFMLMWLDMARNPRPVQQGSVEA